MVKRYKLVWFECEKIRDISKDSILLILAVVKIGMQKIEGESEGWNKKNIII